MSHRSSLILIFLLIGSASVFAQKLEEKYGSTLSIRVSANVMNNLQMLTIRSLDLVNPVVIDNKVLVSPNSSPFAGNFRVLGNPNSRIRITFLQREVLKEQNEGFGEALVEYFLSTALEDLQVQSSLLNVGEGIVALGNKGQLYLWLGANLDLSKATPGTYISEFIVELEYL